MKRFLGCIFIVSLALVALLAPTPALAHHRGHFAAGFVAGANAGGIVTHPFRPRVRFAAPVVVVRAPVFVHGPVHYPAVTCWDYWVNGYWYYGTWVPAHWERVCR